ncbi:MAG: hypothetical protein M1275_00395, partial [Patescibacteria group bacterium]|nr:hypothetical protein [Patescibacteria group bacterium]
EVSKDTQTRIVGTARAEMKVGVAKGATQPRVVEAYEHTAVSGADIAKTDTAVTVKAAQLAAGEYAVVFEYDGGLLPTIFDFSVR